LGPAHDDGVILVELPQPIALDQGAGTGVGPSELSPAKRIRLYNDVEWEEFVLEWATSLVPKYEQVMRSGGTNDHGVDVAGFGSAAGFDGEWDCYQCKHYGHALLPGDAYPEILKVVCGTIGRHYTWPRKYRFVAPNGYGTSLANVLHSPTNLKAGLVKLLTKANSVLAKKIGTLTVSEVLAFVDAADFSVFGTVELHELVEGHASTRWHTQRFGLPLPERPDVPSPSPFPSADEQRYIEQLMCVYKERYPEGGITPATAAHHDKSAHHYVRQREAFYSAEALRVFARDSVPQGTFDSLQDEVFDGVVDTHDQTFADGMDRLYAVTQAARELAMTKNQLLPVVTMRDRTGVCHQLANEDRLTWCHATAE
jgi:hypothetical protein